MCIHVIGTPVSRGSYHEVRRACESRLHVCDGAVQVRRGEVLGRSKVRKLGCAVGSDQHIRGLDVPVHDALGVQVA